MPCCRPGAPEARSGPTCSAATSCAASMSFSANRRPTPQSCRARYKIRPPRLRIPKAPHAPPSFHTMTAPHAASTRIKTLAARSLSSLRDALTNRSHSRDFAYARGDYLRNRVMVVCALFLALLPFWSVIDWFMLAPQSLTYTLPGRAVMLLVLILVFVLARYSRFRPHLARLAAGLLLSAPAAFYALVLATLPEQQQSLVGY